MGHRLTFDNGYYAFPTQRELFDFFGRRRWYDIEEGSAAYADTDTGVDFEFAWTPGPEEDVPVQGMSFEINYGRPAVFGREAAEELDALGETFEGLKVVEGFEQEGPVAGEPFLKGWERANRMAVRVIGQREGVEPPLTVDDETRASVWRWNRQRQDYQAELGDGIFVPRISFFEREGEVETGLLWTDGIPLALPQVDLVIMALAAEDEEGREVDPRLVPHEELTAELAGDFEERDEPRAHLLARFDQVPKELLGHFLEEADVADPEELSALSGERVFERGLVEQLDAGLSPA
jgi:hypothetical protein